MEGKRAHFRTHARSLLHVIARWRPAGQPTGTEIDTETRDLGVGGAFLPAYSPLPAGTRVVVLLSSPVSWDPIEVPAVVRWTREPGEASAEPGMGVQFVGLRGPDVVRLNDLLQLNWRDEP